MANFIEADVIQKIATEAQWLTQTRIPYKGQIMIVSDNTGKVVNMKVGDGSNTFANLNYMFDFENSQRISAVAPGALPTPTEANTYMIVTQVGDYTYGGSTIVSITEDGYQATLWWTGSSWVSNGTVRVKGDEAIPDGEVEEGNQDAVSGGKVYDSILPILGLDSEVQDLKERTPSVDLSESLFRFEDSEGALVMSIDKKGEVDLTLSEQTRNKVNFVKVENFPGYLFAVLDADNKIIFGVKSNGDISPPIVSDKVLESTFNTIPYEKKNGSLILSKIEIIKEFINLASIAVGRESSEGANDAPTIPLTTTGYTHPSVMHLPSGWNGFEYWMAITPTFGIIAEQSNPAAFENPTIFCSNDGVNWQQPDGINNPIDLPPASPSTGYWSDTHLILLPDGYLYCIYRGNGIINSRLGVSEFPNEIRNLRADVYKRSKDGVNWEDVQFIQGTSNEGVNDNGGLMSPAFVFDNGVINCYDVVWNTSEYPYTGQNQLDRIVMRRTAASLGDFKNVPYSQNNVVNFKNRPWPATDDVWHLDGCKWGNTWFLLLNTSPTANHTGNDLYIAYSGDGWNFDVIETPIAESTSYRSCLVPILSSSEEIQFLLYNNFKTDGSTFLKRITLKYTTI